MRTFLISATALMLVASAAHARPMTSAMSCGAVQATVARSGSIVMNFTPTTYDRIVADHRFCLPTEVTEPRWVPSIDARQCFAGYVCREGETRFR